VPKRSWLISNVRQRKTPRMERLFLIFAGGSLLALCTSMVLSLLAMFKPRWSLWSSTIALALSVVGYLLPVRFRSTSSSLRHPEVVSWQFNSQPLFFVAIGFAAAALLIAILKREKHRGSHMQ
jgi:hypothetical protein